MLCRICVEITASKHADMYHRRENHGRFDFFKLFFL